MSTEDHAQKIELAEWERNQQRPAQPDPAKWEQLSKKWCAGCGLRILDARRKAVPGVQLCTDCQNDADRVAARHQQQYRTPR